MSFHTLTLESVRARPIVLKLKRPVVARIATLTDWPLILIDLYTREGVIGRSYLEPYIAKSMRYSFPRSMISARCLKAADLPQSTFTKRAASLCTSLATSVCRWVAVSGIEHGSLGCFGAGRWRAALRAAGWQYRTCAVVQQQWPLAKIPRGSRERGA